MELSREVQTLAKEVGAAGADQLEDDIKDFEVMLEEYTIKDEVQEVVAITAGVYTGIWHVFGAAAIYASITFQGTMPEYAARGISDAWFSVFMVCGSAAPQHCAACGV